MFDPQRLVFIHGLEGSSQGVKSTFLRGLFPGILTPDFSGSLEKRMVQLDEILDNQPVAATGKWTMIGSSFGGLMAAIYACRYPERVHKLILLAPALIWPDFATNLPPPVHVPVVIYHGSQDSLIPLDLLRPLAEKVFTKLEFQVVDDIHNLNASIHKINWQELVHSN